MTDLSVRATLNIHRDSAGKTWDAFFDVFVDVSRVEWTGTVDGCEDVVVYFDTDEPFPYTSFREDSEIYRALLDVAGL